MNTTCQFPFGLLHRGYNEEKHEIKYTEQEEDKIFTPQVVAGHYKYWYNGKEWQEDLGLNVYDYGARQYEPAVGRWFAVDPKAEKFYNITPYNYVSNSTINNIDPDGKDIIRIEGGVRFTGEDAKIAFLAIRRFFRSHNSLKVHLVYEEKTPNIYRHTLYAFRMGKPKILHYDADLKRRAKRRKEALKNFPRRPGMSRDEYPYASTFEGGKGALVAYVPPSENSSQGGQLRGMYKNMTTGEPFLVLPVPRTRVPEHEPVPKPNPPIIPVKMPKKVGPPVYQRILNAFRVFPVFLLAPPSFQFMNNNFENQTY